MLEITAKKQVNGEDKQATIMVDLGTDLNDAVAKFTDQVVFSNFCQSAKITAQAAMRRMLEQGLDQDAITAKMGAWKPGVTLDRTVDPVAALKAKMSTMSAAEKKALLKELGI